jgi:hypothetical protein
MARAPFPAAPFTAGISGTLDQRLAQVAEAINRKADATATPAFSSIILLAPDRSSWLVTISNTGTLTTAKLP